MLTKTVSELRDNLSELLSKVQHSGEVLHIERHGKPVAVMVSAEEHAFLEECESLYWSKVVDEIYADPDYDPNDTVPAEEVFARLRAEDAAQDAALDAAE